MCLTSVVGKFLDGVKAFYRRKAGDKCWPSDRSKAKTTARQVCVIPSWLLSRYTDWLMRYDMDGNESILWYKIRVLVGNEGKGCINVQIFLW